MLLKRYWRRAKKKGIEFNLTAAWLRDKMKFGKCEVTKIPFSFYPKNSALNPYLPSIDRIDPTKGYTKDNCQVTIIGFNNLKSNYTEQEISDFCEGFVKYYEENNEDLLG